MYLDSSNYEIQQYNCDRPGEGQLIFVGKNYCIGSQTIPIRVVGDLKNVEVINVNDQYDYTGKSDQADTDRPVWFTGIGRGRRLYHRVRNNVDVGTNNGSIVIRQVSGTDTYYTGSKTARFNIYYNLSKATVTGLKNLFLYR